MLKPTDEFLKTDVKMEDTHLHKLSFDDVGANAFADHLRSMKNISMVPSSSSGSLRKGQVEMVELNRLQAVAEKERQEAVKEFNRSSSTLEKGTRS